MTTIRGLAATTAVVAIVVAACSASGPPPPTASPSPSAVPVASTGPDDPVTSEPGSPNTGSGVVEPGPGQPTLVVPKPGQKNLHPVSIEQLEARVAGRHVVLNARWWSGVEPCSVLDSVAAKQDGKTITISVIEGNSGAEVACIDIAMLKATPIDLGNLEPGTYTIVAGDKSQAPPITVTVD
jgi:hypothetical protein